MSVLALMQYDANHLPKVLSKPTTRGPGVTFDGDRAKLQSVMQTVKNYLRMMGLPERIDELLVPTAALTGNQATLYPSWSMAHLVNTRLFDVLNSIASSGALRALRHIETRYGRDGEAGLRQWVIEYGGNVVQVSMSLLEELSTISLPPGADVGSMVHRAEELQFRLEQLSTPVSDVQVMYYVVRALGDYPEFVGVIDHLRPRIGAGTATMSDIIREVTAKADWVRAHPLLSRSVLADIPADDGHGDHSYPDYDEPGPGGISPGPGGISDGHPPALGDDSGSEADYDCDDDGTHGTNPIAAVGAYQK
jgi:hypothetical protein